MLSDLTGIFISRINFIFTMDDSRKPVSFIKAYDFVEDLVKDGWAID